MAGGLTISTLNDSSGVLATQNGMSGIAKAWVNFTGATGGVNASFNVSSVTRASAGNYTINFTTAMPDANYTFAGFGSNSGGSGFTLRRASSTTTAFTFQAVDPNVAVTDSTVISVSFHR